MSSLRALVFVLIFEIPKSVAGFAYRRCVCFVYIYKQVNTFIYIDIESGRLPAESIELISVYARPIELNLYPYTIYVTRKQWAGRCVMADGRRLKIPLSRQT